MTAYGRKVYNFRIKILSCSIFLCNEMTTFVELEVKEMSKMTRGKLLIVKILVFVDK